MRRVGALSLLILTVAAGCAGTPEAGPITTTTIASVTPPSAPGSPIGATPVTTPPTTQPPALRLELAPEEAFALFGTDVAIVVTGDEGEVLGAFTPDAPAITIAVAPPAVLRFTYAGANVPGDVTWTQSVTDAETLRVVQPWRTGTAGAGDIALAWLANGSTATYLEQLDRASVTVAAPVCWFIRADGSLGDGCESGFVVGAHDRGIAVWLTVAGLDAEANHLAFSSRDGWEALARRLSERARELGADGINVDVEGYRHEDAAAVVAFLEVLTGLVHEWGGITSYDLIPRTDAWDVTPPELAFWSTAPRRRPIAAAVDYVVVMAYDEYNRYRPAGPVASPDWVEAVLRYVLRYADRSRVILGIPFYARLWDPNDLAAPRAVGVGRIPELAAGAVEIAPDPATGLDRAVLEDGRFFWIEEPAGLLHRLGLVSDLGVAGWAAWRLGLDSPAVWEVLSGSG